MFENNTDRIFWTIANVILTSLILIIVAKAFPSQVEGIKQSILGGITRVDPNSKTQDDDNEDADAQYQFTFNDDNETATLVGIKKLDSNDDLTIPDTVTHNDKVYQITNIGEDVFDKLNLKSVTLPTNLTQISSGAFANNKIETLNISKKIKIIQSKAFDHNEIKHLTFDTANTNLYLGSNAFTNNKLEEVVIPKETQLQNPVFDDDVKVTRYGVHDDAKEREDDEKYNADIIMRNDEIFYYAESNNGQLNTKVTIKDFNIRDKDEKETLKNTYIANEYGDCFYLDKNGHFVKGLQTIDGHQQYFDTETGVQAKDTIVTIDDSDYYFEPDSGNLKTNTDFELDGTNYHADENGKLTDKDASDDDYEGGDESSGDDDDSSSDTNDDYSDDIL